ncbi:MAG: hypothetical protein HZC22_02100 [Rhodocyclales bacterium]|nr:hypothetical protein [Rhodocyclales bacterium]
MRAFLIFLGLVIAAIVGWVWLTLTWSYSEGERAGYVQKFSHKGWLCKTWEGEIAMVTMPGAIPDRFQFTVRDDAVAAQINALAGKRVVLAYEQHKFVPTACFGETEYFVTAARALEEQPVSPAPVVVAPPPAPAAPAPAAPTTAPASPTSAGYQ